MRHRPLQSAQARVVRSCGCSEKRRGRGAYSWKRKSGKSPSLVARASRSCMSRICGIRPGGMTTYVTRVVHTSCVIDIFVTNMGHTSGKS